MDPSALTPPRRLGDRYILGEALGAGGHGSVYRARHALLGTDVAIKLLHAADDEGSPEERNAEFLREAQAVARLRHPNVVLVTDFGVEGDEAYLVMELLAGESLRERLVRRTRLSNDEVTSLVEDVASALAYCHASGVVHRDLKPENVFFARASDGAEVVKVLDFGLAIDLSAMSSIGPPSGRAAGTPHYMSPEQLSGEGEVAARADLFALGVVAFECLAGRRPFDAEAYGELVLQVCTRPLPRLSEDADVGPSVDAWFQRSCARDPDDRFPDAKAQACALVEAFATNPAAGPSVVLRNESADKPSLAARSVKAGARPSRAPRWPYAAGVVGVLALAMLAWSLRGRAGSGASRAGEGGGAETSAPPPPGDPATSPRSRVAVVRLRALSVGKEDAMLAEIVSVELVTRLSAAAAFDVLALASTQKFAGSDGTDYPGLDAALHASAVAEGTLRIADGRANITVVLVDPKTSTVRSSKTYAGPVATLESLAREAAADLIGVLAPFAKNDRAKLPKPAAPEAYVEYAYGNYFAHKRDANGLRSAIEHYDAALRFDADYAPAWVGIADAHMLLPWMSDEPPKPAMERARAALARAVLLDPGSSEVQASRGAQLEYDWEFSDAEVAYRRAIEIDPSNAKAHQWLGEFLSLFRRDGEAVASMARAVELNPIDANLHKLRAAVLFRARRFQDAEVAARLALRLDDKQPYGRGWLGYALLWQGHYDEGLAEIHADPMSQPAFMAPFVRIQELVAASQKGDLREVERLYRLVESSSRAHPIEPTMMAVAAAAARRPAAMYDALEAAFTAHSKILTDVATHPVFDPYRTELRFVDFLAKVGLTPGGPSRKQANPR